MSFSLSIYPWIHMAKYDGTSWTDQFIEKEHKTPLEESLMNDSDLDSLLQGRNSFPELPLVNYSTQYAVSCFEGLKAYPQVRGGLKLFRPERNCDRMISSMEGLFMPPIDKDIMLQAMKGTVRKNADLGFAPEYKAEWEEHTWKTADAVYIRPFTHSEAGIGVNMSEMPWVITVCTTVSTYFSSDSSDAVVSNRIRATEGGTGNIKTSANYLVSALARLEAFKEGYMEAIFLDAKTRSLIEEGSSSNFFALFPGGKLVTPALRDTILPGITRETILELIEHHGGKGEERDLSIAEVMNNAVECFVAGTAAGITPISSITYNNRTAEFASLEEGSMSNTLLKHLKGIQYGAADDFGGWMMDV